MGDRAGAGDAVRGWFWGAGRSGAVQWVFAARLAEAEVGAGPLAQLDRDVVGSECRARRLRRVQAVVADFTLPDGNSVEGRGVVPDVKVEPTRADYAAGRDPFLEVALRELGNAPRLAAAVASTAPSAVVAARVANAPRAMDAPRVLCAVRWPGG